MELIYNAAMFAAVFIFVVSIVGLVRPSLLGKILGRFARRKYILLGGTFLFVGLAIIGGATEPASVKQARLDRERAAQTQKAKEADEKKEESELKKQAESKNKKESPKTSTNKKSKPKPKPVCDGNKVTSNCELSGVAYKTYKYHAAVPAKSHTEQVTSYQQKVTGYCTLCQDGTYSPSCATGRGACSHHGGVAQWNAPRYSNVPVYTTKTIIDAPAKDAYYEKTPQ